MYGPGASNPAHWLTVGNRRSPLSGGPRLAVTPVHAILNYCFALLQSESTRAVSTLGLDPGLGVGLHTDTANRDSLALDVLEPVRTAVESWVLQWVTSEPLRRADFFETATGNCRLMSHLCAKLSQTAPVWGKLVAPWAEYVARALWTRTSQSRARCPLPTRLTQQHRREAKGRPPFPTAEPPKPDRLCRGCGKQIRRDGRTRLCADCAVPLVREGFELGRKAAQRPEFLAKRSATQRMHRQAMQNWNPSDLPTWLTRDVYMKQVQPALAHVAKSSAIQPNTFGAWQAHPASTALGDASGTGWSRAAGDAETKPGNNATAFRRTPDLRLLFRALDLAVLPFPSSTISFRVAPNRAMSEAYSISAL